MRALINRARVAEAVEEGHALLDAWLRDAGRVEAMRGSGKDWEALERELGKALDGFKTGNQRTPALSAMIPKLFEQAWGWASIEYGEAKIRSGHVLIALLSDSELRRLVSVSARSLEKINLETLTKNFHALTEASSEARDARALGDAGAQVARETSCIYQITRIAELTSAPPNWRSYLVRSWGKPPRPADAVLPRTKAEVAYWNKFVAEGWGQGEKQAVDTFLSDLGRLQRDIVGMARYRVLLRAHLVEPPRIALLRRRTEGGRDQLRVGDTTVRITDQPGLQGNPRRWTPTGACAR